MTNRNGGIDFRQLTSAFCQLAVLQSAGDAQLARLYRKSGEARAREIEARLLKLLAAADADHPLVLELRSRRY